MATDYASDLIQDMKIRLRQAAGVPSYDPGTPALPSIHSVADAVAALDPTLPDYLRCRRCHGGLLRGINSTLCIYCGAERGGEGASRKISFNSTVGYRKLLESLDLDGSELVNQEAESKESSKGQDSSKGGVTLSNILDFELRWPREEKEIDNSCSNEGPFQVALVSLSGVDLDNFFSYQKNEISFRSNISHSTSNVPQVSAKGANSFSVDLDTFFPVTRNEIVSSAQSETFEQFLPRERDVITHVNLSSRSQKCGFVEGRQSLNVVNSSDANVSNADDAFADWETDFQSASSATFEAKSKQEDPIQNAADFQSAFPTAVTAELRTMDLQNPIDYQSASYEIVGTESKQTDLFQNSSNFQPENPTALAMEFKANELFQNSEDFLSSNSEAVAADSRHVDLIHNPAGFQFTNLETFATDFSHINHFRNTDTDFSPLIISKSDQNTNIGHNSRNDETGGDLTHEVDQAVSRKDWFQDDTWSQSTKISKETDQLEIISSVFVGELKNEEKETSVSVSRTHGDLWQSSANEINNQKSSYRHDDDLFDDWQDFTTAKETETLSILPSLTSGKVPVLPSETNSGDIDDLEFGCFIQSDSFSSALNGLQSSSHANARQGGDSIANSYEKTGNASALYSGSDTSANISDASDLDASKYKVDMLLAQMPDLSFMLEDSLYVSKKPGSSELNS